jgi:hypothetical protein
VQWQIPIVPALDAFSVYEKEAVLHVPLGTADAYRAAPVWQNFTIKEYDLSGNAKVATTGPMLKAVSDYGALLVSGLSVGEDLRVYNLKGKLVYNEKARAAESRIYLVSGVYIVSSGDRTIKVMVK